MFKTNKSKAAIATQYLTRDACSCFDVITFSNPFPRAANPAAFLAMLNDPNGAAPPAQSPAVQVPATPTLKHMRAHLNTLLVCVI